MKTTKTITRHDGYRIETRSSYSTDGAWAEVYDADTGRLISYVLLTNGTPLGAARQAMAEARAASWMPPDDPREDALSEGVL